MTIPTLLMLLESHSLSNKTPVIHKVLHKLDIVATSAVDSLDEIFCQRCTCKSCGKGAHIGYDCPTQTPIITNAEPCNNRTVNELPQASQSLQQQCLFRTCQQCGCDEYDGIEPDPGDLTSIDPGIRKNVSTTNVNVPLEDDQSSLFAYVVWIFLAFLTYPVVPPYLLSTGNEDTIFDPGISSYHSCMPDVSHRNGTFMKFNVYPNCLNESPMMILSSTCFPHGPMNSGSLSEL
ncbi:hypothetical protein Tco_0939596 [Tanacetum coccineum]|uniref:CCHC-type domain-containing protein n=1 Tax=Tanacetum coccineum TaxID=301880 RepID=A0ABQ5DKH5_9ASTR